jgi:hypothetical protein
MRIASIALIAMSAAGVLEAQAPRLPQQSTGGTARSWIGGSLGLTYPFTVTDGSTGTWSFGSSVQYRGSFEKALTGQPGASAGIALGYSPISLSYRGPVTGGAECFTCDATASVTHVAGVFHMGSGRGFGFQPSLELSVGFTGFSNFRRSSDGEPFGPSRPDWDLTLGLGYGFGYGISRRMTLELVQELSTMVHQRAGLSGSSNSFNRTLRTRVGLRYALY